MGVVEFLRRPAVRAVTEPAVHLIAIAIATTGATLALIDPGFGDVSEREKVRCLAVMTLVLLAQPTLLAVAEMATGERTTIRFEKRS